MSTFRLTADAKNDLVEIRRYTLHQWGALQASTYLAELRSTFHLLAESPRLGRARPDVAPGVLSFPHGGHVVYYQTRESVLIVFAVLHKSMVPESHLTSRSPE
ncbi:type II toxin-antitoxin system RelE/ParE family toxin [Paludibacterium purpuratum]|uniref:Toxin n=1 Tax=Paludibacterium purpuratum TaxID=1144873 RepID=A0A4R7AZE4_9NEIS|nr:type II toxin-antitoxin system RelE/ParE family toxin [Paludibacterium purpuratum]TDR73624.1 toxin ParE1/3/4 [Paludibacterium purpuratum]